MRKKVKTQKNLSSSVKKEREAKFWKKTFPKYVKDIEPKTKRSGSYYTYGGFKIPKIDSKEFYHGIKVTYKFEKEFIKLNKGLIEEYRSKYIDTLDAFMKDLESKHIKYRVVRKTQENLRNFLSSSLNKYTTIEEAIAEELASKKTSDKLLFNKLLKKDTSFAQELSLEANEKINLNKIKYIGDDDYQYTCEKGKKIYIHVFRSPVHLEIIK